MNPIVVSCDELGQKCFPFLGTGFLEVPLDSCSDSPDDSLHPGGFDDGLCSVVVNSGLPEQLLNLARKEGSLLVPVDG